METQLLLTIFIFLALTESSGYTCYYGNCGCPNSAGEFPQALFWCQSHFYPAGSWCARNEDNCNTCVGNWCPNSGSSDDDETPEPTVTPTLQPTQDPTIAGTLEPTFAPEPHAAMTSLFETAQFSGDATYYGNPSGGCTNYDGLLANNPDFVMVALGTQQYQNGLSCGMCIEVETFNLQPHVDAVNALPVPKKAVVVDRCSGCSPGDIDIALSKDGRHAVSWKPIPCPLEMTDPIQLKLYGSDHWYIKIQAQNTRYPVQSIALMGTDGKYKKLEVNGSGKFFLTEAIAQGLTRPFVYPLTVKVTDIYGQSLHEAVHLENGILQNAAHQFPVHSA